MDRAGVQTAADEAVRKYQYDDGDAVLARNDVIAMARAYAESDDTPVSTNTWPLVEFWGRLVDHVAERGKLLMATGTVFGVDASLAGGAVIQGVRSESYRLHGSRPAIEATEIVFRMLESMMESEDDPGQWVQTTIQELGFGSPDQKIGHVMFDQYDSKLKVDAAIDAVNDYVDTSAMQPLEPGFKGVDTGSPMMWRANATSLLIHIGWRIHTGISSAEIAEYVEIAIDDYDVDASTGQEVVIWADQEIKQWLRDMEAPSAVAWRHIAERIAKKIASGSAGQHRAAAAGFARLDLDSPARNEIACARPVAAALGACARASALLTLRNDPNERLIEMSSRLFPTA